MHLLGTGTIQTMLSSLLRIYQSLLGISLPMVLAFLPVPSHATTPSPQGGNDAQLPTYRAAVILNVPRSQALAALSDIPGLSRWLFLLDNATAIAADKDPMANWVHLRLKPILGTDPQDAVLRVSRQQSSDLRTISISLNADNSKLPTTPEYRRIEQLNVQFDLTRLGPNATQLDMNVRVQPPFSIPAMVQPFLGLGPQRSLTNLKEVLDSGRYSNPSVILDTPRVKDFFKGITP